MSACSCRRNGVFYTLPIVRSTSVKTVRKRECAARLRFVALESEAMDSSIENHLGPRALGVGR